MSVKETVREFLKSKKTKLYEKHVLDSEGKLKVWHPVTNKMLFDLLEKAGLEEAVVKYDKELKEEEKEDRDC